MKTPRLLLYLLLLSYFFLAARLLFFGYGHIDRQTFYQERIVKLIPFSSTYEYLLLSRENGPAFIYLAIALLAGNLLLLVPWGVLAPLAFPFLRHPGRMAFSGLLLSCCFEGIQFAFRIGVLELDDILLNASGAVLGYYLLRQFGAARFYSLVK